MRLLCRDSSEDTCVREQNDFKTSYYDRRLGVSVSGNTVLKLDSNAVSVEKEEPNDGFLLLSPPRLRCKLKTNIFLEKEGLKKLPSPKTRAGRRHFEFLKITRLQR